MTDQKRNSSPLHIVLAGNKLTNDPGLIDALKAFNNVSLIHIEKELSGLCLLRSADVLILECGNLDAEADFLDGWRRLRNEVPDLSVVLINGGLTQATIAAAFSEGCQDYFRWPYDVDLLAERIQFLGQLALRKRVNQLKN